MKIVDEKGKLFGKLNILDLLVVILIIAAIAVVAMKLFGGGNNPAAGGTSTLTYTVRVTGLDADFEQRVAQYVDKATGRKDQCMAGGEVLNAYVVDFWAEPSTTYVETADGRVVPVVEDMENGRIDICFVIEAQVASTVTNEVGTQEVRIGKPGHIIKTTHFEFTNGTIENCTWQ